jgi:hypothetical protein
VLTLGAVPTVTALVLDLNGIAFAVQSVIFLFLGVSPLRWPSLAAAD